MLIDGFMLSALWGNCYYLFLVCLTRHKSVSYTLKLRLHVLHISPPQSPHPALLLLSLAASTIGSMAYGPVRQDWKILFRLIVVREKYCSGRTWTVILWVAEQASRLALSQPNTPFTSYAQKSHALFENCTDPLLYIYSHIIIIDVDYDTKVISLRSGMVIDHAIWFFFL